MRRITHLLVLLAFPVAAQAQVAVEPAIVRLGEIKGGVTVHARFTLTNRGAEPVDLVDLVRSCGCVAPIWETRSLAPGQSTKLTIAIRTLGQPEGSKSWPLVLKTRSAGKEHDQPFEVQGTLRNEIVLQPPQIALHVGRGIEQDLTLLDRRDRPLKVLAWESKIPGVRIERVDASAGLWRLKLIADGAKVPVGRHDGAVLLTTDDPTYATLEVPVTVTRIERPRISWSPETPELILAPGQTKASVRVTVRGTVDGVEGNDGLTTTWAASDGGAVVRIGIDRTQANRTQSAIRILSSGEAVAIPVVIRAE